MTNDTHSWLDDIQAVIFDMDGVLIDSEPLHEQAQEALFTRLGFDVSHDEMVSFKGRTEADVYSSVLERHGNGRFELDSVINAKREIYRRLLTDVKPVDGALELLHLLRGHFPLGLATSASAADQRFVIEHFRLGGVFNAVVTAEDVVNPKPHPEPYLMAAEELGVAPGACAVIEDTRNGIRSARAAGCRVVGLAGTFSRADLEEEMPSLIVDRLADLAGASTLVEY